MLWKYGVNNVRQISSPSAWQTSDHNLPWFCHQEKTEGWWREADLKLEITVQIRLTRSFETKKWWAYECHQRNVHGQGGTEMKWYECLICEIRCNTPAMLAIHLESVKHSNKEQSMRRLRQLQPMSPSVRPNSDRAQLMRGDLCRFASTCHLLGSSHHPTVVVISPSRYSVVLHWLSLSLMSFEIGDILHTSSLSSQTHELSVTWLTKCCGLFIMSKFVISQFEIWASAKACYFVFSNSCHYSCNSRLFGSSLSWQSMDICVLCKRASH